MQPNTNSLTSVLKLRQASREVIRELGFLTQNPCDAPVSHSECHALQEIEKNPEISLLELARILKLDKSTTSRIIQGLIKKKHVGILANLGDQREKRLVLTASGKKTVSQIHERANDQVSRALSQLSAQECETVVSGMAAYAKALARARILKRVEIRKITKADDAGVKKLIKKVMPEFGACGEGFAINDPEVEKMSSAYSGKDAVYFILTDGDRVLGGGGVAPLKGGSAGVCELRKMYFLPEVRGLKKGQELLSLCLKEAKRLGFKECYLETLKSMHRAQALYEANGFKRLSRPMGSTGHFGCDMWYLKSLA